LITQLALVDAPLIGSEVVYYATDGYNIKIGRTISPRRRGGELRVEMLHTIPGGELEERRHHRMWKDCRIAKSEWFRPTDDLLLWLFTELTREGRTRELGILRQLTVDTKRAAAA
jgi:hypothetical protein